MDPVSPGRVLYESSAIGTVDERAELEEHQPHNSPHSSSQKENGEVLYENDGNNACLLGARVFEARRLRRDYVHGLIDRVYV